MKTTAVSKKSMRTARSLAGRQSVLAAKVPKLVVCGPVSRMTREEILAADALFLEKMKAGRAATQSSVELVRKGR
jgi:hypothetical protein